MSREPPPIRSLLIVVAFVGLLAVFAWGLWQVMPSESRAILHDPRSGVAAAGRGLQAGPSNPLTAFGEWLRNLIADLSDRNDVVRAADGTNDRIVPLPAWTSVDTRPFFGATETLWQSRRAKLAGVRWSRVVFAWDGVQPGGPRDWRAPYYLRDDLIRRERINGIELVGLLMNTPAWAAARPQDGPSAVPAGLALPVDDPQNLWATFVRRMAHDYRGRIDTWIIWNEPDIQSSDPNAQYHTWAGSAADYARLLVVASEAARQGNPDARIVVGATTYWSDVNAGRPLFLEHVLDALDSAAEAPPVGLAPLFDAVALNLYTSPDDLLRVASVYRNLLARRGLSTPLWLTETNAVPYDDPTKGLSRPPSGLRVTMDEQSSYVIQAYALGLVAGYERLAFHSTADRDTRDEVWGLVRNDGSLRPAFVAYQTAARYLAGATSMQFVPVARPEWHWSTDGYLPNWEVYAVVLDRPAGSPVPPAPTPQPGVRPTPTLAPSSPASASGGQRVTVLWNGDGVPHQVELPHAGQSGALLDQYGRHQPLESDGQHWLVTLPAAAAHSPDDPDGYYFIGGAPVLLVEGAVPPDAPVSAPVVGG